MTAVAGNTAFQARSLVGTFLLSIGSHLLATMAPANNDPILSIARYFVKQINLLPIISENTLRGVQRMPFERITMPTLTIDKRRIWCRRG